MGPAGACSAACHPSGRLLLVAHYGGSAVSTLTIDPQTGVLAPGSVWDIPGGGAEVAMDTFHGPRADAPHPHSVVLDPSGDRVLAPDLGQDKIHVLDIGDHHRLPFLARCVFTPLALRCRRALRQPEPSLLLHRAARLRPAAPRVPPVRQVLLRRARDQLRGRGPLLRPSHRRVAVGLPANKLL